MDRDALRFDLITVIDGEYEGNETDGQIADRMIAVFEKHLALVRPVEGITLTPEEVRIVRQWKHVYGPDEDAAEAALAARLEANAQPGRNLGGRSSG